MAMIKDKITGFDLPNPNLLPFNNPESITLQDVKNTLKTMILSPSGWRKIFAKDGDGESTISEISDSDKVLSAAMAMVFSNFVKKETGLNTPKIVLAQDSRHTGTTIADIMIRIFISQNIDIEYLFISPAPETFCYTKMNKNIEGFAYISASHNPIGHNGIKFGLSTGGVIDAFKAIPLINDFKNQLSTIDKITELINLSNNVPCKKIKEILDNSGSFIEKAKESYRIFTNEIISGTFDIDVQKSFLNNLKKKIEDNGFGIVAEFNGSARALSIDSDYLNSIGVKVKRVNGKAREITHRIVPEGQSLNLCKNILEEEHKKDETFVLGYVPDNDGDRGNVVFYNTEINKVQIIEAQTVFAISVLSEISILFYNGNNPGKFAVCINGPTSMRIDEMVSALGGETFRAEVGEANVVSLAEKKRGEGYTVKILGEGSNGGNITHPAAVRDPLNTVSAIIKLLMLKSENNNPGLFEIWCSKSNQMDRYKKDFTLVDIIKTIPSYITTSAYEDRAILKITTESHKILKSNYEEIFKSQWAERKSELLSKFNIASWEEINTEGINEVYGVGSNCRSGLEKGGLKIILRDKNGKNSAYLWMRGSGTEPVFRVLVDSKSNDKAKEEYLLDWHTNMIKEGDL